ncbi:dTDP-glucose 4,6-dehydratase [Fusarium oxysporum f. sp. raphani 54005]|uniref:dTDP-glucose 4,6-dehydratase n=1 Tax=Fusarium oxysporum f. sp. raphani 54005 TaxID=1089458 RepID=X0BZY8_FUSOX|nr:dTDP-glucose 4,6-dehydratase [Fusarium oxysporum f. sp. raphani 54005]
MRYNFLQDADIWQDAPILTGSTKFEPHPDVKNIMVTGGAGFIASWLVRHLTLTYPDAYNIVSFDKLDYCASLNNTRALNEKRNFSFYQGDITNPVEVVDCLERYNIDTIFHFAAQSHVDLSFGNSYSFTHTNVYGTHVLLESSRKVGIKRLIHVSTDEVYGAVNDDDDDLLEASILAPTNPYAASKAAAEMLFPEKIIPKFSLLLHRGQPVVLHGGGSPTRRYLFAGDAADAFDTILHKGEMGQIYNVGSCDEISNITLCLKLLAEIGIDDQNTAEFKKWVKYTHDRPFNDHRYAVDATKLKQLG